MNKSILFILMSVSLFFPKLSAAQEPQKEPDIFEVVGKETERLMNMLDLEDWQVFYVDSTLMHDFPMMQKELQELKRSGVGNSDIYISVQDKWMEAIDRSYEKFFNPEQWKKYLKSGAARAQKQRDKRKQKTKQ